MSNLIVTFHTGSKVFDLIPDVADRYLQTHSRSTLEIWNFYRQIDAVPRGSTLRIILGWPFRLHWSIDGWAHTNDTIATSSLPGVYFMDLAINTDQVGPVLFTFFWTDLQTWQHIDYRVYVD